MMIAQIASFFWRITSLKTLLIALVVYLFWGGYVMTQGMYHIQELSSQKVEILDLQFHATTERARAILSSYTAEARHFAIVFGLAFDTIYPLVYGFLFIVIGCLVYRTKKEQHPWLFYLPFLALVIIVIDYCENIGIAFLLYNYPAIDDWQILITTTFSFVKWSLVIVQVLLLLAGFLWMGFDRLNNKAK